MCAAGNARAGAKGRGTGICMGLVLYKASPGGIEFLHDILERMPIANDVDQGIANTFLGCSRGACRDKDKYNPEIWTGEYKSAKWAQVPQTRYARHGGAGLLTVADRVDLHVFHPTDEVGWACGTPLRHPPRRRSPHNKGTPRPPRPASRCVALRCVALRRGTTRRGRRSRSSSS